MFYSYPALVSVGSSYINKEYLSMTLVLSIVVSFMGLIFLSGKTAISVSIKGVLLAGLGALSYTSYILYGNFIIKDVPYQVVVAYVCFFSAISFLILGSVAVVWPFQMQVQRGYCYASSLLFPFSVFFLSSSELS